MMRPNRATTTNQKKFRLWSLDKSSGTHQSEPDAIYEGLELSATRLKETYDTLQRSNVEDLDEDLKEMKFHRLHDVTPYFGLAKRGNHLERLHEYLPSAVKHKFYTDIPPQIRLKVLRVAREIGQEVYYMVLDRIIQQKAYTLPKLYLMEDMERAMLSLQSEKLNATFTFYLPWTINTIDTLYEVRICTSR